MDNGWELKEMLLMRFEDADDGDDEEDTGELHNYSDLHCPPRILL